MRPRELFIVGIRLIGVWHPFASVDWILGLVKLLRSPSASQLGVSLEDYAITLLAYLIVGVYCLFGAPHLVGLTYGHTLARHTSLAKTDDTKNPE